MDNYGYHEESNGRPFAITNNTIKTSGTVKPGYPPPRSGTNDYLVEVNSRSKFFKKPTFYKRTSIALLILALLLLIGLIVLLVCYFETKPNVCTTSECLRSATNIKFALDLSVDPCDNFYKYTCGKWSDEHPNHGWYPAFSTFATISEKIAIASKTFFQSEPSDDEPSAVVMSRNFYESCMDVEAIDSVGLSVIYKYLEKAELPLLPNAVTKPLDELHDFQFDWLKAEAVLKKIFSMDVFMGFLVDANIYNRSENVMFVGTRGLSCPLPSPIKSKKAKYSTKVKQAADEDENDKNENLVNEIRSNIIKYVILAIAKNNSIEEPDETVLNRAAIVINNITDFIEELSTNFTIIKEVDYIPYSFEEFQKKTDDALLTSNRKYPDLWTKYIHYLFENIENVTIDVNTDKIYVSDFEAMYLNQLLNFVLGVPEAYLELYMWWVTVYAMVINTSTDVVAYISEQTAPYYGESEVTRSRSIECSSLVTTYMGMAVSYVLVDKSFVNKTKPKVEKMLNEIKEAFTDQVSSISWMDQATKKETLEKSKEMLSLIGYPDWLFQNGSLDEYYENIEIKADTYLENMLNIVKTYFPDRLATLRIINQRTWSTEPIIVNAYNSFPDNAINVPIGILNFPMYYHGLEVLNYGSIGSILGHELTHGFDDTGRRHDKYGNYKQWWPNRTIEIFENMTECFVDQYNNITIEIVEEHVDGRKTLGENIADNGGLNQAFLAYRKHEKKYGAEPRLPGFENYTNDQLFFIAFASIWCEAITPEDLRSQLEYDEHSPHYARVVGTLQNSDEFSEAFNCPKGSLMNPNRKKCKIW